MSFTHWLNVIVFVFVNGLFVFVVTFEIVAKLFELAGYDERKVRLGPRYFRRGRYSRS